MKEIVLKELDILLSNYPELKVCEKDIIKAYTLLDSCHKQNGLIMTCGNGGSAADSAHIVGELMKCFKIKRNLSDDIKARLQALYPNGDYLYSHLQPAVRALSLVDQSAVASAFINDVAADMIYAQEVFGYGKDGDVVIAISTSGNSKNVINACKIAKALNIHTIALTGKEGGILGTLCEVSIRAPAVETFRVQEYHLPIYHALCAMLEADIWN